MAKLTFSVEDIRKLVAHSKGKKHPDKFYGEPLTIKEFLYLVHDQGVYLMSGADEVLPAEDGKTQSFVTYAEGCDPRKDEDWYDQARYLVGGDDFGEPISLDFWEAALKGHDAVNAKTLTVNFGKTKISIAAPKRGR